MFMLLPCFLREMWIKGGASPVLQVRITVVGSGTGEVLKAAGVQPEFVPSKVCGFVK